METRIVSHALRRARVAALLLFAAMAQVACESASTGPLPQLPPAGPPADVRVTPAQAQVRVGATTPLAAAVQDAAGQALRGVAVSWQALDPGLATVSGQGTVTGVSDGTARVVASIAGYSDTATVLVMPVEPPGDSTGAVASVAVAPGALTLRPGTTGQLSVAVRDAAGVPVNGRAVTWTTDNGLVARVDPSGNGALITAASAGSAEVTATVDGKSATITIIVADHQAPVPALRVTRVAVSPDGATLEAGATAQLSAAAYTVDGTPVSGRATAWSTANPLVAAVSASGLVTAVAAGSTNIWATVDGVTAGVTVQVSAPPAPPPPAPTPPPASVRVTPDASELGVGGRVQLTATARDAGGATLTGRTITWRSDDGGVAAVSSAGLVTGVAAGTTRIIATVEGRVDTATITVRPPQPASVTVSPSPVSLQTGSTRQLTATVRDANGNVLSGWSVNWLSGNGATATVSATGLVRAVSSGSTTITAASAGASATVQVTVSTAPPPPTRQTVTTAAGSKGTIGSSDGEEQLAPEILLVGDAEPDASPLQAFITYTLEDVPDGATIEAADITVSMDPAGVFGEPFELGGLYVEHASALALNLAAPGSGSVLLTSSFAPTATVDIAPLVRAAIAAGETSITVRLRFAQPRDNDGVADQLELAAGTLAITFVH